MVSWIPRLLRFIHSHCACNGAHPSYSSILHSCNFVSVRSLPEMSAVCHNVAVSGTDTPVVFAVRTLACNGTVAFFSTDDCSLPLTESFGAAGQPLVRVSSGIECDLPRRMGNGVFTLPSAIEFRIIVKRIFEDLQWKSANVFYDQSYGE